MKKHLLLSGLLFLVTGCGSVLEGPTQQVTLLTPGAEYARCMVHNKDFRYEMETGETRKIMKSEYDLIVDCSAPGNRDKSILVERTVSDAGYGNVANLGIGAAYDYYDNALYEYPAIITVDFRDVPTKSYGLPQHYAPDLPQPDDLPIENYTPSVPRIDRDRFEPEHILRKKEWAIDEIASEPVPAPEPAPVSSKAAPAPLPPVSAGSGMSADQLTREMNPQVFQ